MTGMAMRKCPICMNAGYIKIADLNFALFDDLDLSGKMALVSCETCHGVYNQTALTDRDFLNYYRRNEYYTDSKSPGAGGFRHKDVQRYARIYALVKKYCNANAPKIIDFGCGKGGMLQWLRTNTPAEPVGIETGDASRQYVKKHLGLTVHDSVDDVNNQFDIVILSHVLEHVYSPLSLLKKMKNISHEETVLYIEVPDADAYLTPHLNWRELYFEHINHFSVNGLADMVQAAGLSIIEQESTLFYTNDTGTPKCLYVVVGSRQIKNSNKTAHATVKVLPEGTHPGAKVIPSILRQNMPVSIWGISQYTQLILGSYPDLLEKTKYLFDSSPAKIARSIQGISIRSSEELTRLGEQDILLVPDSRYAEEMERHLRSFHFSGHCIRF
jgi:SAM-dependent methyltransferase